MEDRLRYQVAATRPGLTDGWLTWLASVTLFRLFVLLSTSLLEWPISASFTLATKMKSHSRQKCKTVNEEYVGGSPLIGNH